MNKTIDKLFEKVETLEKSFDCMRNQFDLHMDACVELEDSKMAWSNVVKELGDCIEFLNGYFVVKGTCLPISVVLRNLANCESINSIAADYHIKVASLTSLLCSLANVLNKTVNDYGRKNSVGD